MSNIQARSLSDEVPLPPEGKLLIDKNGKPSHVVLEIKVYRDILDSLERLTPGQLETLDILIDRNWSPELEKRIAKPLKEDTVTWEDVKEEIQTHSQKGRSSRS